MGALSLSSPKQSPAFRASPPHHPHPPQCPEGQGSAGEWAQGQGGWAGGDPPPPHPPGQAGELGTGGERPPAHGEGVGGGRVQSVDGAGMQALGGQRRGRGVPSAHSSVPHARAGPAAARLRSSSAGLIYAETHRHTLIYAAPDTDPARTLERMCADLGPPATHVRMHLHGRAPPLIPFAPLCQPLAAQRHPPSPSLPPAAPTQVITSLHLL